MRVLIANPYGIGDVLFSLPLVRAVRKADPGGFLGYLGNARTGEVFSSWPEVNWSSVFEKDEFRAAWKRSRREGLSLLRGAVAGIRAQRFDTMVDLSLGWHYGFAGWLAGIPRRAGLDFKERGKFLTHRLRTRGFHAQTVADYYLDILPLIGLPRPAGTDVSMEIPAPAQAQAEAYLKEKGVGDVRLVGIVPGGGASWGPNARFKQWAPERFSEVADALAERAGGATVLVFGDASETGLCAKVASGMRWPKKQAVQVPSLLLLAGLLKRCSLVVGNDSGPMHLAALAGARTLSIFGPVDPSVYGPFSRRAEHRVVTQGLACQPCYQGFRFPPCPWDNRCLKELEPRLVMEQVDALLR